jgi:hypothetical protein
MVTDPSFGLTPVIVGALGESPKVNAFVLVTDPALVVIVKSLVPPSTELGLVNSSVVPESLSTQLETLIGPRDTPVTPTRKLPLTLTVAPPVFGIIDLSVLVRVGFCTRDADQVSVTTSLAKLS